MTADLLTRGTTTRSATEIASQIESLGASISSGAASDSSAVSLQTRSDRVDEAFTVFADVVRNPAFAKEELERATPAIARRPASGAQPAGPHRRLRDDARASTAMRHTARSRRRQPARRSRTMTWCDFHHTYWRPDNGRAGHHRRCVGRSRALRLRSNISAIGPQPAAPLPAASGCNRSCRCAAHHRGRFAGHRPSRGRDGSARHRPHATPIISRWSVANTVLGGGYSARLNEEIRIRRGLSYGAGSSSVGARWRLARSSPRRKRATTRRCRSIS